MEGVGPAAEGEGGIAVGSETGPEDAVGEVGAQIWVVGEFDGEGGFADAG